MTKPLEASNERADGLDELRWELNALSLNIKKESLRAEQQLKEEIKRLWFYNWDESWENIKFNIDNVKKYLDWIKDKTWTELDVKSSKLEKWVRTIAIQIAINYIYMKNWESTNSIDWIDGIRGNKTWKWVKEFQTKYKLKNKDGLPWHETINKILTLLGSNGWENSTSETQSWWSDIWRTNVWGTNTWRTNTWRTSTWAHSRINFWNFSTWRIDSNLLRNLEFNRVWLTWRLNTGWSTISWSISWRVNTGWSAIHWGITWEIENGWTSFRNRLSAKADNKWGIEWAILKNTKVQSVVTSIVDFQWQHIENGNKLYLKKIAEDKDKRESRKDLGLDIEAVQSLEDYKHRNFSSRSFEEFILSDEWRAIIVDEIQSHIDTRHKNENGEYDSFYENYPISGTNLGIKLRAAWENKILRDYYRKSWISGDEKQLSEEERRAKEEEEEKLEVISNQITWHIDKIVWDYMKSGKGNFDQDILSELESLLSKWTNGATFEELFSDIKYKDTFKEVLRNKIKIYGPLVRKGNNIDINTWDKQIDLQLRSYLYIYWRIFYSNYFSSQKSLSYYEEILPDIMKVIMSGDDAALINSIKHKELLEIERKLEEERMQRDLQRRQEAARKNRERNNFSYNRQNIWFNVKENPSYDPNSATWAEIVEMSNIYLWDFKSDENVREKILDSLLVKQRAFLIAWERFKKSNSGIGDIVTPEDMRKLYNVETNTIDEDAWREFLNSDIMQRRSQEEINSIYNTLKSFPDEFSRAIKTMEIWVNTQGKTIDDETKKHALWLVIDNVRSIFGNIVEKWQWDSKFEWFMFDKDRPVERVWNDIIMSGTFNWTDIKIHYDLISWCLFMNSYLQHSINPPKIIVWDSTNSDILIWELESFNSVLSNHYHSPDILSNIESKPQYIWNQNVSYQNSWSPVWWNQWSNPTWDSKKIETIKQKYEAMLYTDIDIISDSIVNNAKKQSAINSVVTKFMKTFNIIIDGQEKKSIEFNDWWNWSDLFDFLEIINNSDSDTLDKFQLFMKEIVEYSWLNRWNNNISWPQINSKSINIFNENNHNENISLLRDCWKDFSANIESLKGKPVFESNSKLWFARIIKEKFTNNISKPNRKLDERKMSEFFKDAWLNSPL